MSENANVSKALRGLNTAKVTKNGVYLEDGNYRVKVKNTTIINTFEKGDAFIVEMEILDSTNAKHPKGAERSWYQSMRFPTTAHSEMKKFLYAILGLDMTRADHRQVIEEKVDPKAEEFLGEACSRNTLQGREALLTVVTRASKKKTDPKTGEPLEFSNYIFAPLPQAS